MTKEESIKLVEEFKQGLINLDAVSVDCMVLQYLSIGGNHLSITGELGRLQDSVFYIVDGIMSEAKK